MLRLNAPSNRRPLKIQKINKRPGRLIEALRYVKTKLQTNWFCLIQSFFKKEKMVSLPNFQYDF